MRPSHLLLIILLLLSFFIVYDDKGKNNEFSSDVTTPGGGPAGISATQHLRAPEAAAIGMHLDITVFEAAPLIGGKLALFPSPQSPSPASEGDARVFPWNDSRLDPLSAEDVAGPALLWGNPLFTRASEEVLGDAVEFFELPAQEVG